MARWSNVIGVDDAPSPKRHRGDVALFGVVTTAGRMDGLLTGRVRKDGRNATDAIARMVTESRFHAHAQCVLLQGLTFAGFNVVDLPALHEKLDRPVLVVARRAPRYDAIERALLQHVKGGARKWATMQRAGTMEAVGDVFVQRAGLSLEDAADVLRDTTLVGHIPEAVRLAHLIAAGVAYGHSHGRA